jgi:CheY-like chemotaxis protein
MSNYGMYDDVRRSLRAGFHAHLTKPVNLELLTAALGDLRAYSQTA